MAQDEKRQHLALGLIESIGQHATLDGQILDLKHLHHALDALAAKHAEQGVFQAEEEARAAWVTLPAQLPGWISQAAYHPAMHISRRHIQSCCQANMHIVWQVTAVHLCLTVQVQPGLADVLRPGLTP